MRAFQEQIQYVGVHRLSRREGWNPRFDFGDLEELRESIRQHGVQRPLLLRQRDEISDRLEVIDGDRRFTCIQQLQEEGFKINAVPAFVRDTKISDFDAMVEMMTVNNGKPFLPLEEAIAFLRMQEMGKTVAEIAKQLGRSIPFVDGRLILLKAAPAVKSAVQSGEIGSTMAADIAYKHQGNAAEQERLVKKARQGKQGKADVRAELAGKAEVEDKLMAELQWAISAFDSIGFDLETDAETKQVIAKRAHQRAETLRIVLKDL